MSANFNKPGQPTATPNLSDVIRGAITARLLETYIHFPGILDSYESGKAVVRIAIRKTLKDGKVVDRARLHDVPVWLPRSSGGKAFLQLPLKKGDTGLLAWSQRSLDEWLIKGGVVTTQSARINDINDGVFFPGLYPFDNPVSADNDNVVLKNDRMKIELHPDGKVEISGATDDFLDLLKQTLETLETAKVITAIGPQPFLATDIAKFNAIKTKLEQLIP